MLGLRSQSHLLKRDGFSPTRYTCMMDQVPKYVHGNVGSGCMTRQKNRAYSHTILLTIPSRVGETNHETCNCRATEAEAAC